MAYILMVCPYWVVTCSVKVTATDVGVEHAAVLDVP